MKNEKELVTKTFNKIVTKGVTVEWLPERKMKDAQEAFNESVSPKQWWIVSEDGSAKLYKAA